MTPTPSSPAEHCFVLWRASDDPFARAPWRGWLEDGVEGARPRLRAEPAADSAPSQLRSNRTSSVLGSWTSWTVACHASAVTSPS